MKTNRWLQLWAAQRPVYAQLQVMLQHKHWPTTRNATVVVCISGLKPDMSQWPVIDVHSLLDGHWMKILSFIHRPQGIVPMPSSVLKRLKLWNQGKGNLCYKGCGLGLDPRFGNPFGCILMEYSFTHTQIQGDSVRGIFMTHLFPSSRLYILFWLLFYQVIIMLFTSAPPWFGTLIRSWS